MALKTCQLPLNKRQIGYNRYRIDGRRSAVTTDHKSDKADGENMQSILLHLNWNTMPEKK